MNGGPRERAGGASERGTQKTILVTNDDGVESDAIPALIRALSPLGDVQVIAPERNWSGASHLITLYHPIRCRPMRLRGGETVFASDGSPTDCVRLAMLGFLPTTPDLVVSGINRGSNLGDDITYSGTVAAAMEGLLSNVPSIAVSLATFAADAEFEPAAEFTAKLARRILERGFGGDVLFNVNVPHLPREAIAGVAVTKLGKRQYRDQLIERLDPYGNAYYWVGGPAVAHEAEPGTDVEALRAGKISVTPIHLDLSRHELIEELSAWDLTLG